MPWPQANVPPGMAEGYCGSEMSGPEEYLTIEGLGERLDLKPKTVRNKMVNGTFIKGVHYFSPNGIGPRFKWSAIVAWLEQGEQPQPNNGEDRIPMARGYNLGE